MQNGVTETSGKPIKCRAAVAWEPNQPLSLEEVEVDPPQRGEVRIRIMYTTLCHTDIFALTGHDPDCSFPAVLGHEASGIVESVGEGVTSLAPGDHVVPCFMSQCDECSYCKSGETNLCERIRYFTGSKKSQLMADGKSRFRRRGQEILHFMGCSTFSEYTVCEEIFVAKIENRKALLDKICLLGCGIATGYGAPLNSCRIKPGSSCAVWGLGAVGLAAIMGCKFGGAKRIVAVDLMPEKFESAKIFGATEFVNPKMELPEGKTLTQFLREKYDGGFDYTFEATGNVLAMRQALESTHKAWGKSCILGVSDKEVSTHPSELIIGRCWTGSTYGGWKSRQHIPMLVERYMRGQMLLDEFISRRHHFDQINQVLEHMAHGEGMRCVMSMAKEEDAEKRE